MTTWSASDFHEAVVRHLVSEAKAIRPSTALHGLICTMLRERDDLMRTRCVWAALSDHRCVRTAALTAGPLHFCAAHAADHARNLTVTSPVLRVEARS